MQANHPSRSPLFFPPPLTYCYVPPLRSTYHKGTADPPFVTADSNTTPTNGLLSSSQTRQYSLKTLHKPMNS